jgi:hypothetical protein
VRGYGEIVSLLLDRPNINVNYEQGRTGPALVWALESVECSAETLNLLLRHPNIDVNHVNVEHDTALMLAARRNFVSEEKLALLLHHPAIDVNLTDDLGQTALMMAARENNATKVLALTRHPDTDFFIKDHEGYIASDLTTTRICKLIIFIGIKASRWNPMLLTKDKKFPPDMSKRLSLTRLRDYLCENISDQSNLLDLQVLARVMKLPATLTQDKHVLCMAISDVLAVGFEWNEHSASEKDRRLGATQETVGTFLSALEAFRRGVKELTGIDPEGKPIQALVDDLNAYLAKEGK